MSNHTPIPPPEDCMIKLCALEIDVNAGKIYKKGVEIFTSQSDGYHQCNMYIGNYKKHRVKRMHAIWWSATGEWPTQLLDHINRDKADDRIENLRLSDLSQNALNSHNPTWRRNWT